VGIFEVFADYTPVVAGTFPLGIETATSDADIICNVSHHAEFTRLLREKFDSCENFTVRQTEKQDKAVTIASFHAPFEENNQAIPIEFFGTAQSVWEQDAVRHLFVEARLLWAWEDVWGNNVARKEIRRLKEHGMKTEPAFAQFFGISGEPYSALLLLSAASGETLQDIARTAGRTYRSFS
jgi:hypothetical protein